MQPNGAIPARPISADTRLSFGPIRDQTDKVCAGSPTAARLARQPAPNGYNHPVPYVDVTIGYFATAIIHRQAHMGILDRQVVWHFVALHFTGPRLV